MARELTKAQRDLMRELDRYWTTHGHGPSVRDLAGMANVAHNAVYQQLRALEEKGAIWLMDGPRTVRTKAMDLHIRQFQPITENSSTMRVFEVGEGDWWIANSAEEARNLAISTYGDSETLYRIEEVVCLEGDILDTITFHDDDGKTRTFRQELERRLADPDPKPQHFASDQF